MDSFWLQAAFELIDLRSFSNLWFWIALAAVWSTASHYAVGVPHDLVRAAARGDAEAAHDVAMLAHLHARRLRASAAAIGPVAVGLAAFVAAALLTLAFGYGSEFAQAVTFLLLPVAVVFWLNLRTARALDDADLAGLVRLLRAHRRAVQAVALLSIFLTSVWGMWSNVTTSVLGG